MKAYKGSPPPCKVAEIMPLYRKHIPLGSDHRLDVYHSDGEHCYLNLDKHVNLAKKQMHAHATQTPRDGCGKLLQKLSSSHEELRSEGAREI